MKLCALKNNHLPGTVLQALWAKWHCAAYTNTLNTPLGFVRYWYNICLLFLHH